MKNKNPASHKPADAPSGPVPLKKSLRLRLLVNAVLVMFILNVVVLYAIYYFFQTRMETEYIAKGGSVARTVACMVDGGMIDKYASALEKDAEYENMLRHLRTMQREHGLLFVYVIQMTEGGELFIFDANEEKPFVLGDVLGWEDALGEDRGHYKTALLRGERVEPLFLDSVYGRTFSVFEPVYREDGSVAGYAGVDISMDNIIREQNSAFILSVTIALFIFIALIMSYLFIMQRHVIAPINLLVANTGSFLTGEAPREGEGAADADLQPMLWYGDELAVLERSIIAMKQRVTAEMAERAHAEQDYKTETENQLGILKNILNNLDAMILVTTPDTSEILFINDALRRAYGIDGDGVGQLCYKLFQSDMTERCDFCPMRQIEKNPGKVVVWEQYEELIGCTKRKTALLIDWPGGGKAHLEYGVDITEIRDANERLRLLLDATPLGCLVWSDELKIIECNETAVRLYGFNSKQELIENHYKNWPEFQPDGRLSSRAVFELIKNAFKTEQPAFEWTSRLPDGTTFQSEVILKRIKFAGDDAIAAYIRDLREYKRMMAEIEQQTNLLHMVNTISAIMLQSRTGSFKNDLSRSMEIMAGASGADRVYIWKNYVRAGKLFCYQVYEWSEGAEPQENYGLARGAAYGDVVPGWEEQLAQGRCVGGVVSEMSDYEKAALGPQGILSVLIVPILIKNQFWGFVGFDNCHSKRAFSEKEEMILHSASQIIANAIVRNEETDKARKAEERVKLMLDATPLSCQIVDRQLVTIDCNEASVKLFGFNSKQELIEKWNLEYCSPERQPDGQHSLEKAAALMEKAFEDGSCGFEWLYQLPDGTPIPAEVSLVRVEYESDYILTAYINDLRVIRNLETEVYLDPGTGVYNKRYLNENMSGLMESLSHSGGTLSFLMLDIDDFKAYNDVYGHDEGDKCLKIMAETLTKSLTNADDFVVRYGGEEFAIVLPNTGEQEARLLAERIIENVRNRNMPHKTSSAAEYVTISIGVITGKVTPAHSPDYFIRRADELLYKSKQNGRNQYHSGTLHSESR